MDFFSQNNQEGNIMKKVPEKEQIEQNKKAQHSPLLARFAAMATDRPHTPACVRDKYTMSFQELDNASTALAVRYLQICAESPGPVALHLPWSPEVLTASLAAAKADIPYIPFDTSWPEIRIRKVLERTGARILVISPETPLHEDFMDGIKVIILDLSEGIENSLPTEEESLSTPVADSPLYILFTSGSTGEPKGVVVNHGNIVSMFAGEDFPAYDPGGCVGASCSLGFDGSVFALWGGMLNGCTIVCATKDTFLDAKQCRSYFNRHNIDYILLPVSVFNILAMQDPTIFGNLKKLFIGGELPNSALCKKVQYAAPPKEFYNCYGPTECTVYITAELIEKVDENDIIPAGKPVAAGYLRIADKDLNPLPVGEWGEILIGGKGVTTGYINAPEQTEKAFVTDPADSRKTVYRTGDRGKLGPDGRLTVSGRLDNQVKISGVRIEPGEIKGVLNAFPGVEAAHVMHLQDFGLIAYIVKDKAGSMEEDPHGNIRDFLAQRLTPAMMPREIMFISSLPLNINEKIDEKNLPLPATSQSFGKDESKEFSVLGSFKAVLGDHDYKADDTFLSCGGTSLSAARLIGVLQRNTGIWVQLNLFSQKQTVHIVEMFINSAMMSNKKSFPETKREQVRL